MYTPYEAAMAQIEAASRAVRPYRPGTRFLETYPWRTGAILQGETFQSFIMSKGGNWEGGSFILNRLQVSCQSMLIPV